MKAIHEERSRTAVASLRLRRVFLRCVNIEILVILMFLLSVTVFLANAWVDGEPELIQGDGKGYYAWVRSVVFDGDVDFTNEFLVLNTDIPELPRTRRGTPLDHYPIGMALIESVPVTVARAAERALRLDPSDRPGYSPLYQWSVALFLLTGCLATYYILFRRLMRIADPFFVTLLAFGMLGATNLVEYLSRMISFTHAVDVALVGSIWLILQKERLHSRWVLLIGFLVALLPLVRYTNVLVLPWLLACWFLRGERPRARDAGLAALAAIPPLALQLGAGFTSLMPGQTWPRPYPTEPFFWFAPRLWDSLFSVQRGWLFWHPWFAVLLSLAGLSWIHYRETRQGRVFYAAAAFAVVSMWYVNASWSSWTFAVSFGNRGYLVLAPVLTITVAGALPTLLSSAARRIHLETLKAASVAVVVGLTLWNANLWIGYSIRNMESHGAQPDYLDCVLWTRTARSTSAPAALGVSGRPLFEAPGRPA